MRFARKNAICSDVNTARQHFIADGYPVAFFFALYPILVTPFREQECQVKGWKVHKNSCQRFERNTFVADPTAVSGVDEKTANATGPFQKTAIQGRGNGLVASTSFKPGQKIFSEVPLEQIVPQVKGEVNQKTYHQACIGLAGQLKKYNRQQPEPLALCALPLSSEEQKIAQFDPDMAALLSQVRGNFFVESTDQAHKLVLYPTLTLLNHSCQPNAIIFKNPSSAGVLYALTSIQPNDELLICYNDQWKLQPRHVRRANMLDGYGFTCACTRCSKDDHPIDKLLMDVNEKLQSKVFF